MISNLSSLQASLATGSNKELMAAQKSAQNFESFFVSFMLDQMYSDMSPDGLFGGGKSEEIFRSILNQEYAKEISSNNGIGISDMVLGEIVKMQEAARNE